MSYGLGHLRYLQPRVFTGFFMSLGVPEKL